MLYKIYSFTIKAYIRLKFYIIILRKTYTILQLVFLVFSILKLIKKYVYYNITQNEYHQAKLFLTSIIDIILGNSQGGQPKSELKSWTQT